MSTTLSHSPFAIKLDSPHQTSTMSLQATLRQLHARISKLEARSTKTQRWLGINRDLTSPLLPESPQHTRGWLGVNPDLTTPLLPESPQHTRGWLGVNPDLTTPLLPESAQHTRGWLGVNPNLTIQQYTPPQTRHSLAVNPGLTMPQLQTSMPPQTHHRLGVNPDSSNIPDSRSTPLMQRLYDLGQSESASHWRFLSMENGVIRGQGQTSDRTWENFSIRSQWFPRVRRRHASSSDTAYEEALIITIYTSRGSADGLDYTPEGIIDFLNEMYPE